MAIDSDLIRGHVDTIILKTLAGGDKYGYEIIKEIETRSNGTYELKQPTLYSCLKRLEGQGFISAYWVNSDIGGKRHYYKLTDLGRQEYDNNMREWLSSRSIIDNLIAENADEVLPELTTNFIPLTGTENMTFRKKTDEEKEANCTVDYSSLPSSDPKESAPSVENLTSELQQDELLNKSEFDNFSDNSSTDIVNPFAEFYDLGENSDLDFETDEQDLKLVEEYYNTDENQLNIFTAINEENPENVSSSALNEDSTADLPSDDAERNIHSEESCIISQKENLPSDDPFEDIILKKVDETSSTKFNFKDYKLNNENYFDNVKDEIGGSGFEINEDNSIEYDRPINTDLFDEIINSDSNDDNFNESLHSFNALEENDDEFEITRRCDDFSSSEFEDEEIGNESVEIDASIDEFNQDESNDLSKLNFGFNDENDESESSRLIFGTEEESNQDEEPLPFVRFNYSNFSNDESNDNFNSDENVFDEIENYSNQNFTLRNEQELTESYNYDYDRESELSESRDIALRDEFPTPTEDPQNEVAVIEPEIQASTPIYNDPDATTNLFVDNKRSFVPQYTDNDSRQLLNTLSSYGSIRFSPTNKTSHVPKHVVSNIDELRTDFNNAGIEVRVYERRPKETSETKNYILTNKIKMFTSWLSFAIVSFLLVIGYLIAGPIGYTDLTFVPTALPASFFLFLCLGIMLAIPITFTIIFLLNQTKKVKPKYSAKVAIIFSLLFAVQCLVIIYAVNIPFGLYSFTQIDYNHLLWYLPAICTTYLPLHTLMYTLLFNSKRFHV